MKDYFFGHEFETKKDLTKFVREKIRSYTKPTYIGKEHDDFPFFKELYLRFCPDGNIEAFLLEQNPKYRSPYFDYVNVCRGGRWVCFSWVNCCNKRAKGFNERLTDAMRRAVDDEIFDFRKKGLEVCAVCGLAERCEIDHVIEFSVLRDKYLRISGKPSIEFQDNVIGVVLPEGDFKDDWIEFHRKNAKLQFLCKSCHSDKTAKFCGYNI